MRGRKRAERVLKRLLTANTLEELFRGSPQERAITLQVLEDLSGSCQKYSELAGRLAKREGVSYRYVLDRAIVFVASISEVRNKDLFRQLGVPPSASLDEIRKRWRKLVKEIHPDSAGGDSEAFRRARYAYETLANPDRRARYDGYWVREVAPVEQAVTLARAASRGRAARIKERAARVSRQVAGVMRSGARRVPEGAMVIGAGFRQSLLAARCRAWRVVCFSWRLIASLGARFTGTLGAMRAGWRSGREGRNARVAWEVGPSSNGKMGGSVAREHAQTCGSAEGQSLRQRRTAVAGKGNGWQSIGMRLGFLGRPETFFTARRAVAGAAVFSLAFVLVTLFTRSQMLPFPGAWKSKGALERQDDTRQSSPGLLTELLVGPRSILNEETGDLLAQAVLPPTGSLAARASRRGSGKPVSRAEVHRRKPTSASVALRSPLASPRGGGKQAGRGNGAGSAASPRRGTKLAPAGKMPLSAVQPAGGGQTEKAAAQRSSARRVAEATLSMSRQGRPLAEHGARRARRGEAGGRALEDSVLPVSTVDRTRGPIEARPSEKGDGSGNQAVIAGEVEAITAGEAREFMERFRSTYERLDAGALSHLFASEATENDVSGRESIAAAYRQAFGHMQQARYSLGKAEVNLLGAWAAVRAPFRIAYRDMAGRYGEIEGTAQWWLVRDGRKVKVLRLEYQIGKWPRSLLAAGR